MYNWLLTLERIVFQYVAIGPDGNRRTLVVYFNPIKLSGYHVEVYLNNKIIGDCVQAPGGDGPHDDLAAIIAQKFLAEPLDYDRLFPSVRE